jgi:hypothetical protein
MNTSFDAAIPLLAFDAHQTSAISIGHATRLQPLIQQLLQCRRDFGLPLLRDVLDQCSRRALDQHTQDRIGISTARARHAGRLSEDSGGVGPASGGAMGASDQLIDSGKWTVWHGASLSGSSAARQAPGSPNRVDIPKPSRFQPNLWQNNRMQRYLDTIA